MPTSSSAAPTSTPSTPPAGTRSTGGSWRSGARTPGPRPASPPRPGC